jgi:hypothetical protein
MTLVVASRPTGFVRDYHYGLDAEAHVLALAGGVVRVRMDFYPVHTRELLQCRRSRGKSSQHFSYLGRGEIGQDPHVLARHESEPPEEAMTTPEEAMNIRNVSKGDKGRFLGPALIGGAPAVTVQVQRTQPILARGPLPQIMGSRAVGKVAPAATALGSDRRQAHLGLPWLGGAAAPSPPRRGHRIFGESPT